MRKHVKTRKFSRTSNERKQLFRNLIRSLALHGSIETSETKAKAIKPQAEKLVTRAKVGGLNSMRAMVAETGDIATAQRLLEFGKLFEKRAGGYLRILKLDQQIGDDTTNVRLEWVEKLAKAEVVIPEVVKTKEVKENTKEVAQKKTAVKEKKKTVKTKK